MKIGNAHAALSRNAELPRKEVNCPILAITARVAPFFESVPRLLRTQVRLSGTIGKNPASSKPDTGMPRPRALIALYSKQDDVSNGTHRSESSDQWASLSPPVTDQGTSNAAQESTKVDRGGKALSLHRRVAHVSHDCRQEV